MKKLLLLALIILGASSCFAQTRSKLVHNDSILVKLRITGRFFDPLKMADVIIMNEIKTL